MSSDLKKKKQKISQKKYKRNIFSTFKYQKVISVKKSEKTFNLKKNLLLVTGIVNSNPILNI